MKTFSQIFFKGLIVVLPVSLTFYFLFWAGMKLENLFGSFIKMLVGKELYLPGSGIILIIVFVFLVGILVTNYLTSGLVRWFTNILERFPLIKAIYNPLKDLMTLIPSHQSGQKRHESVVLVRPFDQSPIKMLGLVTQEDLSAVNLIDTVSVYVPLSYILGGVTLLVPKDQIEVVNLSVEQALKLSITSWVKAK